MAAGPDLADFCQGLPESAPPQAAGEHAKPALVFVRIHLSNSTAVTQEKLMNDRSPISEQFQALLAEFCASVQMPLDDGALGIEFEADGHLVLIVPDPRDADRMLVDVNVMRLDNPAAGLTMALHRLNHQSRLEHDWVISVDAADQISLHTQRDIGRSRAGDLQALLAEGIDRAQALVSLCEGLSSVTELSQEGTGQAPAMDPSFMIRG
jgi:hypothetical protein